MNNLVRNFLLACLILLSSLLVRGAAPETQEVNVLVKVHSVKEAESKLGVAIALENEGLTQLLSNLSPDDEVLLKGEVVYYPTKSDGAITMNPRFHIKSIHPVSLKRLGLTASKIQDPPVTFSSHSYPGPKSIQVSPEIAQTITLTASVLMIQDLSGSAATQPMKHEIDRATFLSAGALATGYFIWKQLVEKKR